MWKYKDIFFAVPGEGGGSGGDGSGSMAGFDSIANHGGVGDQAGADDWGDDLDDGGDPFEDFSGESDDALPDDIGKIVQELAAADKPDTTQSGILDATAMRTAASAMIDTIKADIAKTRLDDNLFGEEFQNGNPAAIRAAIEGAFRQARQSALADGIQPMSLVSNNLYSLLRGEMQQAIAVNRQAERDAGTLEALVPALKTSDQVGSTIMRMVRERAEAKGLGVQDTAKLLNMFAKKYNIKAPASQTAARRGPKRGVVSRGNQALDDIFGAFVKE